jgi:hypothetical protein
MLNRPAPNNGDEGDADSWGDDEGVDDEDSLFGCFGTSLFFQI